jgi:neutral amino acid transport system permease protein
VDNLMGMQMDVQLIQLLVNGVAVGCIIALAAVGLTLTYGILRLSNFAHGDFMTLGAYLTFLANTQGINLWVSILLGAGGTIVAMLLTETVIWAPLRSQRVTSTTMMIISIGLALFLRNGIILIWGGDNQRYKVPVLEALRLGENLRIPADNLIVMGVAIISILGLHYLLQNTKIGKAMRAVADLAWDGF